MQRLSDGEVNVRLMSEDEQEAAWDFWFDLAPEGSDVGLPYSRGLSNDSAASSGTANVKRCLASLLDAGEEGMLDGI
jgi:hypothetical protein